MIKKIYRLVALVFMAVFLSACSTKEEVDRPVIYTSFFPVYDLTQTVVGEADLEVRSLMPANQDPHMWEPTLRDLEEMHGADLLIVNGANMESWLPLVQESLPDLDILVLSDSADLITYKGAAALGDFQFMTRLDLKAGETYEIEFGHTHEEFMRIAFYKNDDDLSEEELIETGKEIMQDQGERIKQKTTIPVENGQVYALEMGHQSGQMFYGVPEDGEYIFYSDRVSEPLLSYLLMDPQGQVMDQEVLREDSTSQLDRVTYDPHSWMSVENPKHFLNSISMKLSDLYPEYEKDFNRNKVEAVSQLRNLEFEYQEKFNSVDMTNFVTTHYAYQYLARDFDLKQYPLQGLTSMEDPSLNTIRRAIYYSQHYGVDTIFYEENGSKKGAATIAAEIGGQAVPLNSMEYVHPSNQQASFIEILTDNLEKLYQSMR